MSTIELPYDWDPMTHQLELWNYMENGGTRAVAVWHRRAGKDSTALNFTSTAAIGRPGVYWHMLPTQKQARKVVWDGIDRKGRRMIDQVFPQPIRKAKREQEMQIELVNGSIWQLCGSDNYDSLVGANPVGVIFSEWSLCDPKAWDFIRPILAENGGWAIFIYTPRGKNHGYTLAKMAKDNPKWHHSVLTVDDTRRDDGSPIITQQAIQDDRDSGMAEGTIQQEYYCSFDVAAEGAYYVTHISDAKRDNRIGRVPPDPLMITRLFADIGGTGAKSDNFVFLAAQFIGHEIRCVNHYEAQGQDIAFHLAWMRSQGYNPGVVEIVLPHDGSTNDRIFKVSYESAFTDAGYKVIVVTNQGQGAAMMRIEAGRRLWPSIYMDKEKCDSALEALGWYHEKRDEARNIGLGPDHDWSSHTADAFGLMCVFHSKPMPKRKKLNVPGRRDPMVI